MATVSSQETYEAAERASAAARANVAAQLTDLLMTAELSGSRDLVAHRLQAVMEAERSDDRAVKRHARMELTLACALWTAAGDTGPG